MSLSAVIDRAAAKHPEQRGADADLTAARALKSQTKSAYGPTMTLGAGLQIWNDALEIDLGGAAGDLPPPNTAYEELVAGFLTGGPIVIRDQLTWNASIAVVQPLTPLWDVYLATQIQDQGVSIAQISVDATTRRLQRNAAVVYIRLNQAEGLLAVAQGSVNELREQAKRLTTLVELGAAQRTDQLRIQVALAAAQKDAFGAEANVHLARAALAVALGEPELPNLQIEPIPTKELVAPSTTLKKLVSEALERRDEILVLDRRIEQSLLNQDLIRMDYYPDLVAVAQAQHLEGQDIAGETTAFVGASLNWKFFEWGRTSYEVDEAQAIKIKVEAGREQASNRIGLQVKRLWFDYEAARQGHDVADVALEQAEEAFRVETERFEAGQSTTTDLLSAQTAVSDARNNREVAYYEALVFRIELIWAVGRPMTTSNLIQGMIQ